VRSVAEPICRKAQSSRGGRVARCDQGEAMNKKPHDDTIAAHLKRSGVDRRDFLSFCGKLMVAAPFGLAITNHLTPEAVAAEIGSVKRPSVIWLHMQECTGCTETLLRTSEPDLADLIFNVISLDYHETVMAAAGKDAENALHAAMKANDGKYICVVEGAVPTKDEGKYLYVAGKKGIDLLQEVTSHAAAVVSIGSCASWGGVASAGSNPTGATGIDQLVKNKPVVNIPGCPPNPYVFLAVALQVAKTGKPPALDNLGRPKFAYDRLIHDHCPRRPHFDAGRFAKVFGDEGHQQGWCLYRLGCKGPVTHSPCSTRHFNEIPDVWPIGIGHPCFGCTEKSVGYTLPLFSLAPINDAVPTALYPPVETSRGVLQATATGAAGVIGGVLLGAGYVASKKFSSKEGDESVPGDDEVQS
jgi:hydrogenase small subunit